MLPNLGAYMNPDVLKQSSEVFKNMSDDDLKRYMDQAKTLMPGMPAMSPEMMRFASQQMNNMTPEQIQQTMKNNPFAQNMGQQQQPQQQQQQQQQQPSLQKSKTTPASSLNAKDEDKPKLTDIQKANAQKEDANQLYKDQSMDKACEKYYEAINTIRFSEKFKNSQEGRQIEIACRLNIALCKQAMQDYATVIDQCERVLNYEPQNWKACFRMANAMYSKSKDDADNLKSVLALADKAYKGNATDAKVKEFYEMIKSKVCGSSENDEKEKQDNDKTEEVKQPNQASDNEPKIEEVKQSYAYTPTTNQTPIVAPHNLNNMPPLEKAKLIQQNSERIKQMDDGQISGMINMMKSNKDAMKQMYKAQGMDMSDDQFEMISNMMTPEMVKSASDMVTKNPDLLNQLPQNMKPPQNGTNPREEMKVNNTQASQQRERQVQQQPPMPAMGGDMNDMMKNMMNNPMMQQMMNNPDMMKQAAAMMGGGQGGLNPGNMQEMMNNPSLKGLLGNPDFLSNTLSMLKGNKGMLDMMQQQNPGFNMNIMIKALEVLVKVSNMWRSVKQAWSNMFVRLAVFAVIVMIIAYFFN